MFKIVPKGVNNLTTEVWAHGENDEVFLGGINENDCARLSGIRVRNEYLKAHWERAPIEPTWQDVTGEVGVSETGTTLTCGCWALNTHSTRYRFVKVDAYVIPEAVRNAVPHDNGLNLGYNLLAYRTTLLRVERKAE